MAMAAASLVSAGDAVNQSLRQKVDSALATLGRVLLPPRCLLCAEPGADGHDLCATCAASLNPGYSACAQCALPLGQPAAACGRCLRQPPPYTHTIAAGLYQFPLDALLPRFKFHADLAAGRELVRLLLAVARHAERPQALIPVPLHPQRLRQRGYNQALELARPLSRALELPLQAGLLRRIRATAAQSELDAAARRRNVRGAFAVSADASLPDHVALIDDVMTTGATVSECARVLRRAGVARVDLWLVARAPRRAVR